MQISGRNRATLQNSPHFQVVPYAHASSYGSLGSHGSYNDGTGLGSSYGSYGDNNNNMFAYYSPAAPSAMAMHAQAGASMLGTSPDARRRIIQFPHGAGNFAPLPLGTSPSQFTPPNSYTQVSGGSPGHYGPTSPARGGCHVSPLGKMAAVSQFNRRKSWGYSGGLQSLDSSVQKVGHLTDGVGPNQSEGSSQGFGGGGGSALHVQSNPNTNPNATSWIAFQNIPNSFTLGSNLQFGQTAGVVHEKPDSSLLLPDPGDWDPNYR